MTPPEALILGVVQGLTELLPVSSSGHLAIVPKILGMVDPPLPFTVAVHVGTAIAVIACFRRDVRDITAGTWRWISRRPGVGTDPEEARAQARVAGLLMLSSVPAAIAGLLLEDTVEGTFGSVQAVGAFLLVTALVLWGSGWVSSRRNAVESGRDAVTWTDAVVIGFGQACALFPGLSRSGATIGTGMSLGLKPVVAVRFAFLMSIPVILGGGVLQAIDLVRNPIPAGDLVAYLLGAAAAALSAWAAIVLVFRAVRRGNLRWYGVYCGLVGLACIVVGSMPA